MFAWIVSGSNGMVANFICWSCTWPTFAAMRRPRLSHGSSHSLSKRKRRSTWSIFFMPMMPFENFNVTSATNLRQKSAGAGDPGVTPAGAGDASDTSGAGA